MLKFSVDRLAIVSITAENLSETVHFYRDVLNLRLLEGHGHRHAFDLGGDVILVVAQGEAAQTQAKAGDFPVLTFAVEDIHKAHAHLSAHKILTLGDIQGADDTHWVLFHDPAGNLVELAQFGQEMQNFKSEST